jgi:prophage regulatory protein
MTITLDRETLHDALTQIIAEQHEVRRNEVEAVVEAKLAAFEARIKALLDRHRVTSRLQRFIRKADLPDFTGLGRTKIYELIRADDFPKPVQVNDAGNMVAWLESELLAWQTERIASRDENAAERAADVVRLQQGRQAAAQRRKRKRTKVARP